ncbi:DUF2939 domain-containing protein [Marilutibacter chinensis]|uniref:DUF2939 domain-containing protein n=1 Tax=Marilutibacter chinensis TaxID=2912247 RepID=A0ABS9HPP9_9GAMM|nr:DUF2939 domain-containing protein [Lysobacter chinensis]MCF7220263.1 DUF2939 domain-containing protein [Lysobacter chinensis]
MKKLLLSLALLATLLLALFMVSPLYAVHGIRSALRENDAAALARHIDFPALQRNLRAQSEDYLARQAGPMVRDTLLGSIALEVAGRLTGSLVEAVATPQGVAMLITGRVAWRQGTASGLTLDEPLGTRPPEDPFEHARYRLQSHDRFSVSLDNDTGSQRQLPVEVVLRRQGLSWKVTEINLGETDPGGQHVQ